MLALVAGGTGFIGRHLVRDLVSQGLRVRVLARNKPPAPFGGEVEVAYGDVREAGSLEAATRGVDVAISAFGLLGRWGAPESAYRDTNRDGVRNLLDSCRSAGVGRFLHISSAGVLGPLPRGVEADESFPHNPSNAYEKSKCEAEKEIIGFAAKHGLSYTIVRPEFVYGPGDRHVLGLFRAIRNRRFFILGDGRSRLHPTYIDDLVRGIRLCINNPVAAGRTYLITGEKPLTVMELAATIAAELGLDLPGARVPLPLARAAACGLELVGKISGAEPVLTRSRVKFFSQNRAFSFAKARAELGYSPQIDFREGVRRTIGWYRNEGYL